MIEKYFNCFESTEVGNLSLKLELKFIKMNINFFKSFDGMIHYELDGINVANIPIEKNYQLPEKMKFFIGGQTSDIHVTQNTALGVIRNLTIEALAEPTCFKIKSCRPTDSDCTFGHGDKILIFKNKEKISEIERGFMNYEECFETKKNDVFELHAGGSDGVSTKPT